MHVTGQVPIYSTREAPSSKLCQLERARHNGCLTAVLVHPDRWGDFVAALEAVAADDRAGKADG